MNILTKDNTKENLEDRIVYLLSEILNDNAPIGQEAYRYSAKKVIAEIKEFKPIKNRVTNTEETAQAKILVSALKTAIKYEKVALASCKKSKAVSVQLRIKNLKELLEVMNRRLKNG